MEAHPEKEVLKRLPDPKWDPRERILFITPVTISIPKTVGAPAEINHVEVTKYTPTEIDVDAQTSRSGFILINDQFDPDWEAEVNGQKVKVLRADYILRAIPVAAGTSSIKLHYVAHYHIGIFNIPVVVMNNFSDAAMLTAWAVAGIVLLRRKSV